MKSPLDVFHPIVELGVVRKCSGSGVVSAEREGPIIGQFELTEQVVEIDALLARLRVLCLSRSCGSNVAFSAEVDERTKPAGPSDLCLASPAGWPGLDNDSDSGVGTSRDRLRERRSAIIKPFGFARRSRDPRVVGTL